MRARPLPITLGLLALLLCLPRTGLAQAGPEWLLRPTLGGLQPSLSAESALSPDRGVAGQAADFGLVRHRLRGIAPLTQSPQHEWALFGRLEELDIDTRALLPTTGEAFPDALWDLGLGTAARRRLDNGWILGGALQVGSPSDRPFASLDEVTLSADAFLRVPWSTAWAGIALLNYSTGREFAPELPLPGFALAYEPDRQLSVLAGIPFSSIRWAPTGGLELTAAYLLLRTVRAQVSLRLLEPLRVFAGFDWESQRFFRHDRQRDEDRLTAYEKRIGGGLRWDPTPRLFAEASGGYAFDRFWFEGEKYRDRDVNRLELGDGPYLQLRLGVRF